jgi:hypothetical protein
MRLGCETAGAQWPSLQVLCSFYAESTAKEAAAWLLGQPAGCTCHYVAAA